MTHAITLRPAHASDSDAIATLFTDEGYPAGPSDIVARLDRFTTADRRVIVAEHDEAILGFVAFVAMPRMFRLWSFRAARRSFRNMLLCGLDERCESRRVTHGHVRQNFPVEIDSAHLQTVNQLAVGDAIIPRRRADALDPKRAVIPLPRAAVAIGVAQRTVHRLLHGRGAKHLRGGGQELVVDVDQSLAHALSISADSPMRYTPQVTSWNGRR